MAYTYDDWVTLDDAAEQLARLNLHIREVTAAGAGGPDVAADGKSVQRGSTNTYLQTLMAQRKDLQKALGLGSAAGAGEVQPVRRV